MRLTVVCTLLFAPLAFADPASKSAKIEQLLAAMNIEAQQKEIERQAEELKTVKHVLACVLLGESVDPDDRQRLLLELGAF